MSVSGPLCKLLDLYTIMDVMFSHCRVVGTSLMNPNSPITGEIHLTELTTENSNMNYSTSEPVTTMVFVLLLQNTCISNIKMAVSI